MKLGYLAVAVLLAGGMTVAQEREEKRQTKVKVEDGKTITVTGCVQRSADGYQLTNVAGKDGAMNAYILSWDDGDNLAKHVGHRVEITGKAADKGDGKLKIESKTESKVEGGDKTKTESKAEVKGDLKGLPYLGVKSLRMIASVCP